MAGAQQLLIQPACGFDVLNNGEDDTKTDQAIVSELLSVRLAVPSLHHNPEMHLSFDLKDRGHSSDAALQTFFKLMSLQSPSWPNDPSLPVGLDCSGMLPLPAWQTCNVVRTTTLSSTHFALRASRTEQS